MNDYFNHKYNIWPCKTREGNKAELFNDPQTTIEKAKTILTAANDYEESDIFCCLSSRSSSLFYDW